MARSNRGSGSMPAQAREIAAIASGEGRAATDAERAELQQELEIALERRHMRRALVAKLVEEYRTRPMPVRARSLRTALVERDLSEEECEALERAMAKARGDTTVARHPRRTDDS